MCERTWRSIFPLMVAVVLSVTSPLASAQDFSLSLGFTDTANHETVLEIGTAPGAGLSYDDGLEQYAPRAPPAGAFYAHLLADYETLLKDYRATTVDSTMWTVHYGTGVSNYPVAFTWNPAELSVYGEIYAIVEGRTVDLRKDNEISLTDASVSSLTIVHTLRSDHELELGHGWNLIGLPARATSVDPAVLFSSGIAGTLYGFNGAYAAANELGLGSGYWLRSDSETSARISGLLNTRQEYVLSEGWNLISPLSTTMPVTSLVDADAILSESSVYEYNGAYLEANELKPGRAYWVHAANAGTVSLTAPLPADVPGGSKRSSVSVAHDLDDFGRVTVTTGDISRVMYFGGSLPDNQSMLRYGLPPLPPKGAFDARLAPDRWLSTADSVVVNIMSRADEAVALTVELPASMNARTYVLEERINGETAVRHEIGDNATVELTGADAYEVAVYQFLATSISESETDHSLRVLGAYPNPFSDSATIRFSTPTIGNVKADLLDVLGRPVAQLIDEQRHAGEHYIRVDAGSLPSGVYIYRINADGQILTGNLVLVR